MTWYHVMSRGNRRQDIYLDDSLLGEHGLRQDTPEARQEFERRTEARRVEPGDEASLKALRRGWCLGSDEFKQQKLEELDGQDVDGVNPFGSVGIAESLNPEQRL